VNNRIDVRVSTEVKEFYNGKPDLVKEALSLFMRSQQKFIKIYEKESK
jgi:hypothetical protein